ncbi:MAG TPA: tetraacyldisaccharide 4'-kinase [Nitrospiria bacterium]|nr:tetraacyldisaccharide 4'-kinase [Nitrospiria bacterium]
MRWGLAPLSWVYGGVVRARRWWYERGWGRVHALGRPVVSVGNLSVGGTGKTPVVIAISEALLARGVGVTVLSRGYRGMSERGGALVSDGRGAARAGWEQAGDEPALIARRAPGASVMVGRDRFATWRRFGPGLPPGVVVLDDGFQHLAIARDENLALLDATDDDSRLALLPRGRLREPWSALSRAIAVVITRVDQAAPGAVAEVERRVREQRPDIPLVHARFAPTDLREVATGRSRPLDDLRGAPVLAVAGIGRFESFPAMLERCGARPVGVMPFPDHHAYSRADADRIAARARRAGARMIVTTEKDAVKLERLVGVDPPMWAVRIEARIEPAAIWNAMLDRLAAGARA